MFLLYICHTVQIWSELASSAKLDYKFHILEMSKVSLLLIIDPGMLNVSLSINKISNEN